MTNQPSAPTNGDKWHPLIYSRSMWDSLQDSLEAMSSGICLFPEDDPSEYLLSDEEAIRNDWQVIGKDMHIALNKAVTHIK